jgi:hypothetical protein
MLTWKVAKFITHKKLDGPNRETPNFKRAAQVALLPHFDARVAVVVQTDTSH